MIPAEPHRTAQYNHGWCGIAARTSGWVLLLIMAAGRLAAADPVAPLPRILDHSDPRAKISSLIRPYLDLPAGPQGLDHRLRDLMVAASRMDLLRVRLDVPVTPATLADIAGTGAQVVSASTRWNCVTAEATMAQIDALARLPEVVHVAAALRPRHHGAPLGYASQADAVLHTNTVRSTYGVTGAGQIIGVISDSVNLTTANGATYGATQAQSRQGGVVTGSNPGTLTGLPAQSPGSNNLPASIAVFNLDLGNISTTTFTGDTDEGEALLEVAYHIAPGASYAFSSAGNGDTDFATSIQQLQGFGCTLMCDDIGFPDEPMFQDGPVAQAAAAFVAAGGIYCSAAGNAANTGILTTYLASTASSDPHSGGLPNGNTFHSWGAAGAGPHASYLPIVIGANTNLSVTLEWNQTYHSFGLGPGPATDLDLYVYDAATGASSANIITASTDSQAVGNGDPFEFLQVANPGSSTMTVYLVVDLFAGPSSNLVMRLLLDPGGGSVTCPSPGVLVATTIQGHPAASAVLAIGAVDWNTPTQVEPFTSFGGWGAGGIPYYFDATGNPLAGAPQLHNKPDLTATDGLFVSDPDFVFPGPGSNPQGFYGTSCATPSATAAAALAWCVQPGLTNSQITANLTASATDITAAPASAGADGWSGHGLVNAFASIGAAVTGVTKVTSTPASGILGSGTVAIHVTFTNPVTVTGTPVLLLNTSPPESASYTSGSGSTTLTFTYTIHAGDTSSDLDVASIAALALSGGTITAASTTVSLNLPKPGSPSSLGVDSSLTIASVPDALTITATPATSNGTAFTVTFTFAQPLAASPVFTASMITVSPGTKGALSGSGTTYTMPVTASPLGGAPTEIVTVSVPANVLTDVAGNPNLAGSGTALVDTVPPTLTITLAASAVVTGQVDTATFTFSKAIVGFSAFSVTATDGTIGALSGSGALYTMPVTAGAVGTMTIAVDPGGLHDLAGNALVAPASVDAAVTAPPPSSSHHCGFGNFFGLLLLSGLFWLRRSQAPPRAG